MITARPNMTAAELLDALDRLDLEQLELARLIDVNGKTVRRWTADDGKVPGCVSLLMRLLLERPELRELMGAKRKSGRGRPPRRRRAG